MGPINEAASRASSQEQTTIKNSRIHNGVNKLSVSNATLLKSLAPSQDYNSSEFQTIVDKNSRSRVGNKSILL